MEHHFASMSRFYASTTKTELICPVCNKKFKPAPAHVYHIKDEDGKKLVCSYNCERDGNKSKKK